MPKLHGQSVIWRDYVISEYDYATREFRRETGRAPRECRTYMIADHTWKYIYAPGYPPVLFNLKEDPDELMDLGAHPDYAYIRQKMQMHLADWSLQYRQRETWAESDCERMTALEDQVGVLIGYWDEKSAVGKDPNILPKRKPLA